MVAGKREHSLVGLIVGAPNIGPGGEFDWGSIERLRHGAVREVGHRASHRALKPSRNRVERGDLLRRHVDVS
jgi:hypothetical protein